MKTWEGTWGDNCLKNGRKWKRGLGWGCVPDRGSCWHLSWETVGIQRWSKQCLAKFHMKILKSYSWEWLSHSMHYFTIITATYRRCFTSFVPSSFLSSIIQRRIISCPHHQQWPTEACPYHIMSLSWKAYASENILMVRLARYPGRSQVVGTERSPTARAARSQ